MKPDRHIPLIGSLIVSNMKVTHPDDWWLRLEVLANHLESVAHNHRVRGMFTNQRIIERDHAKRNA